MANDGATTRRERPTFLGYIAGSPAGSTLAAKRILFLIPRRDPCLSFPPTVFALCSPRSNTHRRDEIHFASWEIPRIRRTLSSRRSPPTTYAYRVTTLATASAAILTRAASCMHVLYANIRNGESFVKKCPTPDTGTRA